MNDERKPDVNMDALRAAARDVVAAGQEIQDKVRNLTVEALRAGSLEGERVKQVVQAVLEGAKEGAEQHGEQLKSALSRAVAGLDDALAKSASATKLAIEEAAGHIRDFSQHDIKRAMNDLEGLESTLIDVVRDAAKSSSDLVNRILNDLASHARNSGTAVGRQATESMAHLRDQWRRSGRESLLAGADAAKSASARIARAAGDFLAGLADTIEGRGKQDSQTGKPPRSDDTPGD